MVCDYEGSTHTLGGLIASFTEGYVEFQPAGGLFSVEAFVDGLGKGSYTVDIGSGVAVYGTAVYGTSTYAGASRSMKTWPLPLNAEGRTMAVRARYTGSQQFRFFVYSMEMVPEGALSGVA
jgi:hypothetical protein